jgi:hypothetical protein
MPEPWLSLVREAILASKMTLSRSKLLAVLVVALAATAVVLLWPKGSQASSEELIRQKAIKMARAAENKDLGYIMDQVSDRFVYEDGGSKRDLRQVLAAQMLRGNWLRVFVVDLAVTVTSPTSATLSGKYIFGRSRAETLKDLAKESELSSYAIDAKLEKEQDDWKFVAAKHRPIDPAEFL